MLRRRSTPEGARDRDRPRVAALLLRRAWRCRPAATSRRVAVALRVTWLRFASFNPTQYPT